MHAKDRGEQSPSPSQLPARQSLLGNRRIRVRRRKGLPHPPVVSKAPQAHACTGWHRESHLSVKAHGYHEGLEPLDLLHLLRRDLRRSAPAFAGGRRTPPTAPPFAAVRAVRSALSNSAERPSSASSPTLSALPKPANPPPPRLAVRRV